MIGHTPGPWSLAPYSRGAGERKVTGPCLLPRPRFGPVAAAYTNLAGPMDDDCVAEMHANARLIAAAPELLEVLQAIANDSTWRTNNNDLYPQIHRAIRKATGESA